MRRLEEAWRNCKTAVGAGHVNPTILDSLSETETQLATLASEAEKETGDAIEIPPDFGDVYRTHIDHLAKTLSAGEVVGLASDELQ